jgi:hypothetical protein
MITLPRIRDAIVYIIPRELPLKGNTLLGVGMVLWDANVYVIPREFFRCSSAKTCLYIRVWL